MSFSAHQLSLAQLEERKTVTAVTSTFIRYLEARGSIPRGETFLLHVVASLYLSWLLRCAKSHFYGHRENFVVGSQLLSREGLQASTLPQHDQMCCIELYNWPTWRGIAQAVVHEVQYGFLSWNGARNIWHKGPPQQLDRRTGSRHVCEYLEHQGSLLEENGFLSGELQYNHDLTEASQRYESEQ